MNNKSSRKYAILFFYFMLLKILAVLFTLVYYDDIIGNRLESLVNSLPFKCILSIAFSVYTIHFIASLSLGVMFCIMCELITYIFLRKYFQVKSFRGIMIIDEKDVAMVTGGFLIKIVFISKHYIEANPLLRNFVLAHEFAHMKSHHMAILSIFPLFFVGIGEGAIAVLRFFEDNLPAYTIVTPIPLSLTIAVFTCFLVGMRVIEIHADLAAYKILGSDAYKAYKFFLESIGEKDEKGDWLHRITHTSRRDLVLKYGDPLAPHSILEFTIPGAAITAGSLTSFILWSLNISNRIFMLILFLLTWGSVILIFFLLSFIVKPIVHIILRGYLTTKGVHNLSALIISAYLALLSIGLLLTIDVPIVSILVFILAFLVCLVISLFYVRELSKDCSLFRILHNTTMVRIPSRNA